MQLFGFAAQQFIHYTVQNYQQDWNDVLIEGTIMRITLPENRNTVKTTFTVHSLKKGKGEEECVEQPAIPVLKRGRWKKTLDVELLNLV